MLIQKYQNEETGLMTWHREGEPAPGPKWFPIKGHTKYIKKADTEVNADRTSSIVYGSGRDEDEGIGSMKQYALTDPPGTSLENKGQKKVNKYIEKISASKKKDVGAGVVAGAGVGGLASYIKTKLSHPEVIKAEKKAAPSAKEYHTAQANIYKTQLDAHRKAYRELGFTRRSPRIDQQFSREINRLEGLRNTHLGKARLAPASASLPRAEEKIVSKVSKLPKKALIAGAVIGGGVGLAKHYLTKNRKNK